MNDVNAFKSWLLKNYDYSENTLQSYLFTFKDFFKINNEINSENARRYIQHLEKENRKPKTICLRTTALKKIAKYKEAEIVKDVNKDDGAKWSAEKVLQNCKWDGERLTLPQIKLNKKSYGTVKSWIEEAGGKWNMKEQAFTFDFDADRVVEILMQGKRYNIKKEFQFFATPDVVADLVASKFSGIDANMKILEPSAGRGALVKAVLRSCPKAIIDCYELMPENRPFLEKIEGARIAGQDFLKECRTKYQLIIANPPFSNNQDIQHTYAMFDRLEYGGEMAVITSQHWKIATDSVCSDFRKWLDDKKASIEDIPEGAFKESGTQVKTTLIFIKKNRQYNDQLSLF